MSGKGAVMPAIRASFSERENVMVMTCNFIHPPTLHGFPCIATTSPPRRSSRHKRRQVSIFAPLIWDACIMGYLLKEHRMKKQIKKQNSACRWIGPTCSFSTSTAALLSSPPALSAFPAPSPSSPVVAEHVPEWNIPVFFYHFSVSPVF